MLQCAVKNETSIPGLTVGNEMVNCVKQAENRLHAGILRFNTLISETNHMKQEIELLRKEREIVSGIQRKLEKELKKREDDAAKLIDSSKSSHASREYCLSQLKQLRGIADKEHSEYTKKMRELIELLEADKSAHESIQKDDFNQLITNESERVQDGKQVLTEINKTAEYANRPLEQQLTPKLFTLFQDVRNATGMTRIGDILDFFHVKELENSSLFMKYNLNVIEIEGLQHILESTRDDINRVRISLVHSTGVSLSVRSSGKSDDQIGSSRSTMRGIEIEAGNIKKNSDDVAAKITQLGKLSESVRTMVRSIFSILFIEPNSILKFLPEEVIAGSSGNSGTPIGVIAETNLVGYLSAIESRVNTLLLSDASCA